jgi:hypothetical protein
MLFVIGEDDDATACAFSRGCCEVSGTAVKAVSGRLPLVCVLIRRAAFAL